MSYAIDVVDDFDFSQRPAERLSGHKSMLCYIPMPACHLVLRCPYEDIPVNINSLPTLERRSGLVYSVALL
jgi:hypothetical protein